MSGLWMEPDIRPFKRTDGQTDIQDGELWHYCRGPFCGQPYAKKGTVRASSTTCSTTCRKRLSDQRKHHARQQAEEAEQTRRNMWAREARAARAEGRETPIPPLWKDVPHPVSELVWSIAYEVCPRRYPDTAGEERGELVSRLAWAICGSSRRDLEAHTSSLEGAHTSPSRAM